MEILIKAGVFLDKRRQKEADNLGAERGGQWFWGGEQSEGQGVRMCGVLVSSREQETEIRLRLIFEGIIGEATTVPMIVKGKPVVAFLFREGPNFQSARFRFGQIVREVAGPGQRATITPFRPRNEPVIS